LPSGKMNRTALPSPDTAQPGALPRADDAPRTELEATVAAAFVRVLGIARAGVDDDFFQLGGHSLLATRLVFELRRVLARDVPLSAITRAPTVGGLAAFLAGAPPAQLDAAILADAIPPALDIEPIRDPLAAIQPA